MAFGEELGKGSEFAIRLPRVPEYPAVHLLAVRGGTGERRICKFGPSPWGRDVRLAIALRPVSGAFRPVDQYTEAEPRLPFGTMVIRGGDAERWFLSGYRPSPMTDPGGMML